MAKISQQNTGQKFPVGVFTIDGTCNQCGYAGKVAGARLALPDGTDTDRTVCAECLADFVAGAPMLGARVYVDRWDAERATVRKQEVRAR